MSIKERLSGNEAVANAMRQINPDVMPAYPITPSTEIPQYFTSFVSNGKVDTVFIPVESEHRHSWHCVHFLLLQIQCQPYHLIQM